VPPADQDEWLMRSIEYAFTCGASVVSLIPTRPGNGALDALAATGEFVAPRLDDVERSVSLAHARRPPHGRIVADLWDLERISGCPQCTEARRARLHAMNLEQRLHPMPSCDTCGLTPTSRS